MPTSPSQTRIFAYSQIRFYIGALATLFSTHPAAAQQAPPTAPSVKVGGVVYAQYSYLLSDSANGNNFDVTRAYINVLGTLGHGLTTRVTPDIFRGAEGALSFRLKYAFFAYTPEKSPLTFKFGQIQTPWVDSEEGLWDYRMQGTIALDRAGYLTSSDLGAGIDGMWGAERFQLSAAVVNGEGYQRAGGDKRKDVAARASYRLAATDDDSRFGGLRASALAHIGARTGGGDRNRFIGMLSYRSTLLTVAGEYAATADGATAPATGTLDGRVISAFAVLHFKSAPAWALLGRFDAVDPNTDVADNGYTTIIAGVSNQLTPNLRLLLDIDHTNYQVSPVPAALDAAHSKLLFQTMFTF